MTPSRLTRVEENRTKKRLYKIIAATIVILVVLVSLGIPVLVRISALLGTINSTGPTNENDDKTPPFAPVLSPVTSATNSAQLKVEGYAEAETTLVLRLNGDKAKEVLLPADGTFSFADIELENGKNTIYATTMDKAGNESAQSNELIIMYKKGAPKLEVTEPTDGQTFGKNQQEISIKGKTDKENTVYINDRFVSVADDGSFSYNLKLNDGENKLIIKTKDMAGNEIQIERTVMYSSS